MSLQNVPTIELLQLLDYLKTRGMKDSLSYLYHEYKDELGERISPLALLF